jgi:phospholipid-translocating ATPase
VYYPLDKHIVREMWVKGDLKDQLGLSHRKVQKAKIMSDTSLEAAPMFVNAHGRSLSDLHHTYEPAMRDSPPYAASSTGQTTYTDTPPMTDIIELLPREIGVQYAQPITKPSKPSDLHVSPPMNDTPSPKTSYYSVTDIPIPSPLPSPKYQLPSGEITTTPPTRRSSIATSRATSIRGRGTLLTPMSTSPLPSHPLPPGSSLPIPTHMYGSKRASAGYSGAYEMQTYEEQGHMFSGSGRTSQTSNTSFATAEDFWIGEEGASSPNYAYQHTQMLHTPSPQLDWFDGQQPQPHVASQADEDDRSTIVGDSRRGSVSAAWEGGRAM